MVPLDMRLGREQLTNILRTGHSRIPVHEPGSPQEVVGLLLVKELVLLDPDDEVRPYIPGRAYIATCPSTGACKGASVQGTLCTIPSCMLFLRGCHHHNPHMVL